MLISLLILLITNSNNEPLHGVKVELVGTDKVFYTNINGQVSVPFGFDLKLDYISYQTKMVKKDSIKQSIILISR
jgi:hypothetical protein